MSGPLQFVVANAPDLDFERCLEAWCGDEMVADFRCEAGVWVATFFIRGGPAVLPRALLRAIDLRFEEFAAQSERRPAVAAERTPAVLVTIESGERAPSDDASGTILLERLARSIAMAGRIRIEMGDRVCVFECAPLAFFETASATISSLWLSGPRIRKRTARAGLADRGVPTSFAQSLTEFAV